MFEIILFSVLLIMIFLFGVYIEKVTKISQTIGRLIRYCTTCFREKRERYYLGANEWCILIKALDYFADWEMPYSYNHYTSPNGCPYLQFYFTLKPQIDKNTIDIAQIASRLRVKLEQILSNYGIKWTIFPDYIINNDMICINLIYAELQSDIKPYAKEIELIKMKRQKNGVGIGKLTDDELNNDLGELSKEEEEL